MLPCTVAVTWGFVPLYGMGKLKVKFKVFLSDVGRDWVPVENKFTCQNRVCDEHKNHNKSVFMFCNIFAFNRFPLKQDNINLQYKLNARQIVFNVVTSLSAHLDY